jgi:sigma-B regulation protein RsbU (phosphoserine phosphatase)
MQDELIKILLIEDVPKFARLLREMLEAAQGVRFDVEWVESLSDGLQRLAAGGVDLVLLDLSLSDCKGLDSFDRARDVAAHIPIIVLSSLDDETVAVTAVHQGAQDYLVKGQIDGHLLVRSIRYAIERKRTEVALLQAEEKFRSIFENIVEGIFQTTADGHYLNANPALARIYGYEEPDELINHLTDIGRDLYVDSNRRHEFVRLMDQFDVVKDFESQIYRKDGSVIWISENVRAVRDSKHHLLFYEGTVEDITERKRAEEAIRNSEALYHSLVESLPQNIFRKDLNERFTFANRRFCITLGKSLDEILGKTDFDFFPPSLAAKYQQDDRKILETGQLFETIEEHQPPGGEKLYVNVVKTPTYDSTGKIIGLQGIFWDITERRRAEERIRKAGEELAASREELRVKNEQMEEDLKMAREIQQAIIPQQYPSFPRSADTENSVLRFCHRYFPTGAVGGDFFNILALSDTKAGVFICDVMGHGVRSALVTAIVRALVEELTPVAADPGHLMGQLNRDLRAILKQSGTPLFTTAFYLVIDLASSQISYANAGHPKPLLIHRDTEEVELLPNFGGKSSPALGLLAGSVYPTSHCSFAANDMLMLFTDGLYDVEGIYEELFNPQWLLAEVRKRAKLPAGSLFDELLAEIKMASDNGAFTDDVCLVGIEVAPWFQPDALQKS